MTITMTEKRIYFLGEASINGKTVQTERIFILKAEGEIEGAVILKAMEEGTDICKWGIRMEIIDNEKFQYETFDCATKN